MHSQAPHTRVTCTRQRPHTQTTIRQVTIACCFMFWSSSMLASSVSIACPSSQGAGRGCERKAPLCPPRKGTKKYSNNYSPHPPLETFSTAFDLRSSRTKSRRRFEGPLLPPPHPQRLSELQTQWHPDSMLRRCWCRASRLWPAWQETPQASRQVASCSSSCAPSTEAAPKAWLTACAALEPPRHPAVSSSSPPPPSFSSSPSYTPQSSRQSCQVCANLFQVGPATDLFSPSTAARLDQRLAA
mmetsp:Transcript_46255/g.108542  ORF Transcript_46255/g.108542 Transcript_46255/m.108542 type:complete len:243 (-) Transcript_46255:608-1336(-)